MKRIVSITAIVLLSTSTVLAQDICESDFDSNGAVDANDVTTFLDDFGRNEFNNPCPPCMPLEPVFKTGQTQCYDESNNLIDCAGTGQDGEHQSGYVRFTDNGDGTVSDNMTGLIWTKDASCFEGTWFQVLSYCNELADGQCGLSDVSQAGDWRLANVNEFKSLYEEYFGIGLAHPFVGFQTGYWTSTTRINDPPNAYTASPINPFISSNGKNLINYGWCVRGGH